jgi:hypothetical protein
MQVDTMATDYHLVLSLVLQLAVENRDIYLTWRLRRALFQTSLTSAAMLLRI